MSAGSARGLLAMNHEALTDQFLHAARQHAESAPGCRGRQGDSRAWRFHRGSPQGRRQVRLPEGLRVQPPRHADDAGPDQWPGAWQRLDEDEILDQPAPTRRGTINNCGTGYTPWGTFLTGEENWSGYFRRGDDELVRGGATARSDVSLARYGRAKNSASRHGWETAGADDKYARWDITQTGVSADGRDD